MRIETDTNLVFDTEHPRCSLEVIRCQGQDYAFVTAVDVGPRQRPLDTAPRAQYWGKYFSYMQEESIKDILATGGKWPALIDVSKEPAVENYESLEVPPGIDMPPLNINGEDA